MTRIVVLGGGIAGVEAALTLARTTSRGRVTLVSQWPSLRVLPQLVYVPFGASEQGIDVRLNRALAPHGVDLKIATCQHVDVERHELMLSSGTLSYETLVVATGTIPETTTDYRLRSLTDAVRLRNGLDRVAVSSERGRSIMLRVPSSCTWPPPAFEFALLLAKWRTEHAIDDLRITVAVEESEPLAVFNLDAALIVRDRFERAGIELMTDVPGHRIDQVLSSLAIDFGGLSANRIPGLPPVDPDGFYRVDDTGRVAADVYVVGDAALTSYKAGFAVGWHARRVAAALGADLSLIGEFIDGIPLDECEYQMDMADETLRVRFTAPYRGRSSHELRVSDVACTSARPDKLVGTLTHGLVALATTHERSAGTTMLEPTVPLFRASAARHQPIHADDVSHTRSGS